MYPPIIGFLRNEPRGALSMVTLTNWWLFVVDINERAHPTVRRYNHIAAAVASG